MRTCEFVSPKHPDKLCDFIADSILDGFLAGDPKSRVAVELLGGHGRVFVSGEVTSAADVDVEALVRKTVGEDYQIVVNISKQSPEISRGVDTGGAGDQGIMMGYATSETETSMPLEYETARKLCQDIYKEYPYDGKTQVTIESNGSNKSNQSDYRVTTVVASFQNTKTKELEELVRSLIKSDLYLINPAGEWNLGGFDADSGLSGRKIVIDNYGPEIGVGGGSFSGKDPTKVDRSAAYMCRRIAVDLLKKHKAKKVKTKLAYAIGVKDPVMAVAEIDGQETPIEGYDVTPRGIIELLKLDQPIYAETARWGHFGRNFSWS
ncbi:MAG TPA: methionine adenosyltransferase domain-containing protein [Patescibacteria group bacterium]|nr:methionine adenosyltransferase domain-containing protein [Patescibacteria group bacterium]